MEEGCAVKARGLVLSEAIPIRHEHGSSSLSLFTLKRQEIGARKAASGCSNAGEHRARPSHGHKLDATTESNPYDARGGAKPHACTSVHAHLLLGEPLLGRLAHPEAVHGFEESIGERDEIGLGGMPPSMLT